DDYDLAAGLSRDIDKGRLQCVNMSEPIEASLSRRDLLKVAAVPAVAFQGAAQRPAQPEPVNPWFFIQLSDPQLGHHDPNDGFEMETATFEYAIASTIRLMPQFVVITGDLTNVLGHAKQIAEYKRIVRKLPSSIPMYHLPGNHDIDDTADRSTLKRYRDTF